MSNSEIVGKTSIRSLRFTQHRDFQKTINERVTAYLRENNIPGRDVPAMYVKTVIALAWWLGTYLLLLLGHFPPLVNIVLCLVWAMAIASIGFNVMHDANHGGYSDHPLVNKLVSLSAEMLGMSGFRWRVKHNVWHHTYTNIAGFESATPTPTPTAPPTSTPTGTATQPPGIPISDLTYGAIIAAVAVGIIVAAFLLVRQRHRARISTSSGRRALSSLLPKTTLKTTQQHVFKNSRTCLIEIS